MLYTLCIILILVASILIILAVLVQNPKSGMAANFGASNQVMGVRQTSDFLEKFTWTMAVVIVVLSLLATLAMDRGLVARSNVELEKDANAGEFMEKKKEKKLEWTILQTALLLFAHRHCFKFWLCQSNQLLRLSEGRVGLSCERLPLSRLDMDPAG